MSNYKLYYFDITGLGEPLRYLLNYLGIPFEDKRISFEEWPNYKSDMPTGMIPVLEIDGKKYNQSKALMRYLARKNNLYGKDEMEAMLIDSVADSIDDFRIPISQWYWSDDQKVRPKMKDIAFQKFKCIMDTLETQTKSNSSGLFVGDKVSWVDIYFTALGDCMDKIMAQDMCKDHPMLKKLTETIKSNSNVKAYLEKRPKTRI